MDRKDITMARNTGGCTELEQQIIDLITEHLEQDVKLDTPLRDICDDLDMMELFMAVEEDFDVEISPLDEESLRTPADFARFVSENSPDDF